MHCSARTLTRAFLRLLPFLLSTAPAAAAAAPAGQPDWLIDPAPYRARIDVAADSSRVDLNNGLVRRTIKLQPNAATVGFDNLITGAPLLRAVRPEARVTDRKSVV